jgi:hypothetical protein
VPHGKRIGSSEALVITLLLLPSKSRRVIGGTDRVLSLWVVEKSTSKKQLVEPESIRAVKG